VHQRGSSWYYKFRLPEQDPSTGQYPWISKGGFDTERAWKAFREAMRDADRGCGIFGDWRTSSAVSSPVKVIGSRCRGGRRTRCRPSRRCRRRCSCWRPPTPAARRLTCRLRAARRASSRVTASRSAAWDKPARATICTYFVGMTK